MCKTQRAAWQVHYQGTPLRALHLTENAAWIEHDRLVIAGLDPDGLAVVQVKEEVLVP